MLWCAEKAAKRSNCLEEKEFKHQIGAARDLYTDLLELYLPSLVYAEERILW